MPVQPCNGVCVCLCVHFHQVSSAHFDDDEAPTQPIIHADTRSRHVSPLSRSTPHPTARLRLSHRPLEATGHPSPPIVTLLRCVSLAVPIQPTSTNMKPFKYHGHPPATPGYVLIGGP